MMKIENKSPDKSNVDKVKTEDNLEDCTSVMNPEMARNYEENEPCNDGTKTKKKE